MGLWEDYYEQGRAYVSFYFTVWYCLFILVCEWTSALFPKRKTFRGETILITGGASGIGRLIALKFAEFENTTIIIWDINTEALQSIESEIRAKGARAFSYRVDVSKREQVYDTAQKMRDEIGSPVTVLINNAGIVAGKPFLDGNDAYSLKTMEVNAIAHFWTIKAFVPHMAATDHGHLITIASSAGLVAVDGLADYCASKAAAIAFHESIRQELRSSGKLGVDTTLVNPFYINTGMFHGVHTQKPHVLPILEPDYVVERVMEAAICRRHMICLPRFIYLILAIRAMPVRVVETFYDHLGIGRCLDKFTQTRKLHDQ